MKFHMLFEQSGTFKNVFKQYGNEAFDYDILDDYGQTDFKIDLFNQIQDAYQIITDYPSYLKKTQDECKNTGNTIACMYAHNIFFKMKPETDFIIAFFPCTSFTDLNEINFTLQHSMKQKLKQQNGNKQPKENIDWLFKQIDTREYMFKLFIKFCFICEQLGIPTIIENPVGGIGAGGRSYLSLYSPYRPSYIDKDRSLFGDKYKKSTMFFSINFDMKEQFSGMYFDKNYDTKTISIKKKTDKIVKDKKERSEIAPRYADNFYKRFLENKLGEK